MVLAIVHPKRLLLVGGKLMAVEFPDEILGAASAPRSASGVAYEQPHRLVGPPHPELHEIRALPYAGMHTVALTERAFIFPALEIGRGINLHLLSCSQYQVPLPGIRIPKSLRVAEISYFSGYHRIERRLGEGFPVIGRESGRLGLILSGGCVESNDGTGTVARSIGIVNHAGAAEDRSKGIRLDRGRKGLPMDQVP